MGRYGDLDYGSLAKHSFLLGVGLFVVGAGGELLAHTLQMTLPAWEETLLYDAEILGLLVAFVSPWVFAVILPLTE